MNPIVEIVEKKTLMEQEIADNFAIVDSVTREVAVERVRAVKALVAQIESEVDPLVKTAYAAHKGLVKFKTDHIGPLEAIETLYRGKIDVYDDSERLRIKQESDRLVREEEDKRLHVMEAAEGWDKSLLLLCATFLPIPEGTPEQVPGSPSVGTWSAEVTDIILFLKSVMASPKLLGAIEIKQGFINGIARKHKSTNLGIPGLKGVETLSVRIRRNP